MLAALRIIYNFVIIGRYEGCRSHGAIRSANPTQQPNYCFITGYCIACKCTITCLMTLHTPVKQNNHYSSDYSCNLGLLTHNLISNKNKFLPTACTEEMWKTCKGRRFRESSRAEAPRRTQRYIWIF